MAMISTGMALLAVRRRAEAPAVVSAWMLTKLLLLRPHMRSRLNNPVTTGTTR